METTEGIIRDNTLNDILSNDDAEEMHQELEEKAMDQMLSDRPSTRGSPRTFKTLFDM